MISSVQQHHVWIHLHSMRSKLILLFIIIVMILIHFQNASAQEVDNKNTWSFGFQAGVLSGNLPSALATNTLVSRFNVENDYYFFTSFQAGYTLSEYESLHINLSRGEFSVFTDHEFWPDVIFKNQFYTATLSTQFGLRRFIEALPNRLDPYGSFGLGLMSSRHNVAALNSQTTAQNDFSDKQSSDLSFIFTTGFGVDYSLNSRMSIFFQFDHHFLSTDIIDKNLAGDVLRNDFIQTTNNWSTFTGGIRLKFGRAKAQTQTEPSNNDFQIISTINADRLPELEEQVSDLSDSVEEENDRVEEILQVSEQDERVEEGTIESDLITDQPQLTTVLSDSILETQPSEEITDNRDRVEEGFPVTDSDTVIDSHEDDFIFVTQPRFGLKGIAVERISGSFTLSLHSFSDHDEANDTILKLNSEGYRVITQIAIVNGRDYLRVGVGQFETRGDARTAAENLPVQYRKNYFIVQI